ncbi:MAG: hypothetical protein RL385_3909 [Pseudomonadota bacterium]|jgi:hypothetical protein
MIRNISLSARAVRSGGLFDAIIESDNEVEITLRCFRRTPPPPQLVPCGRIRLQLVVLTAEMLVRTTGRIVVNPQQFPLHSEGKITVTARDKVDYHFVSRDIDVVV